MSDIQSNENQADDDLKPVDEVKSESVRSEQPVTDPGEEQIEEIKQQHELTEAETIEERASRFQEFFNDAVETNHPKMTDSLLTFIELKDIDEELAEIDEVKGDLPDSIKAIRNRVDTVEKELNEKKQSVEKLEQEGAALIESNVSYEGKISKYDEQKFNVRSNKEYDEIVKAIDSLFEEVEKNEKRIKEVGELSEMLAADVVSLEARYNELSAELAEKQTLLDELNEQYKNDEQVLREKRNVLLEKLSPQSCQTYERVNTMYKGEATAIVRKGNCSGCYNSIPPQRVIEIKSAERIYTCQSCGRILIPEEIIANK